MGVQLYIIIDYGNTARHSDTLGRLKPERVVQV